MVAKKQSRLSISITEELEEKLGMFRDKINVSEICRRALSDVVDTLLRDRAEVQEKKGETIARLRKEREESDYYEYFKGLSDGYSHAPRLSFREISTAKDRLDFILRHLEVIDLTEGYFPNWVLQEYTSDRDGAEFSERPTNLIPYAIGWHVGVSQFWFEIAEEVLDKEIDYRCDAYKWIRASTKDISEGETEEVLENSIKVNDVDKKTEKQEKPKRKGGESNAKSKRKNNKS